MNQSSEENLKRTDKSAMRLAGTSGPENKQPPRIFRTGPPNKKPPQTIIVDSEASEHVARNMNCITEIEATDKLHFELIGRSIVKASKKGVVDMVVESHIIQLENAYFIASLHSNVLSRKILDYGGIITAMAKCRCTLSYRNDNNRVLGEAKKSTLDGLYRVVVKQNYATCRQTMVQQV